MLIPVYDSAGSWTSWKSSGMTTLILNNRPADQQPSFQGTAIWLHPLLSHGEQEINDEPLAQDAQHTAVFTWLSHHEAPTGTRIWPAICLGMHFHDNKSKSEFKDKRMEDRLWCGEQFLSVSSTTENGPF